MTPTSDERREVAERLRKAAIDDGHIEQPYGRQGFQVTLRQIIGTSNPTRPTLYRRLADLIDPTCEVDYRRYSYGRCAYEYHLSCGHSVDRPWRTPPAYCPECGARCIAGEGDGE